MVILGDINYNVLIIKFEILILFFLNSHKYGKINKNQQKLFVIKNVGFAVCQSRSEN